MKRLSFAVDKSLRGARHTRFAFYMHRINNQIQNRMKTLAVLYRRLVVVALLFSISAPVISQEIPITTSSKEAKKLFIEAREKAEAAELVSASELLDKAIALDPNFALAYMYRSQTGGGSVLAKQNRDQAFSLIEKVSPGEKLWIMAAKSIAEANRSEFVKYSEELLKMFPKDKRVLTNMGFLYNFNQDFANAISYFNKALEIDKNHAAAINQLGYIYMTQENWAEAEKMFKRQITTLPNYPNPYDSYAVMLMRSGRFDEAIANFKIAMEKSPAFINSFTGMGLAYCHKGDYVQARECFQKQFELAPNVSFKAAALDNKVNSYLFEGNYSAALKTIDEIRALAQQQKLTGAELTSYGNSGWVNLETGDLEQAAIQFENGRAFLAKADMPPTNKESSGLLQLYQRCALLSRVREFESVTAMMAKAKELVDKRNNAAEQRTYILNLARHEFDKGNYDNVIQLCSKTPVEVLGWYLTARAYEMKGDRDSARKYFEKVVNANIGGFTYAMIRPIAKQKLAVTLGAN
jgi:tetratricopeptide (TPR) repeat protein